jgi:hypothetical protein
MGLLRGAVATLCLSAIVSVALGPAEEPSQELARADGVLVSRSGSIIAKLYYKDFTVSERCANTWWGHDALGYSKIRTLWNLVLSRKGEDILPLRRSAFADLCDFHQVTLKELKSGFDLVILGGDGIAGYRATLRIRGNQLVSRTVESLVAPESWSETAEYVNK